MASVQAAEGNPTLGINDQLARVWSCFSLIILLVAGGGCSPDQPPGGLPTAERPPDKTLPPAPVFSVVAGSTQKICQLTGEYDYQEAAKAGVAPQEKPTLNRTYTNYKIHGTDLGASFEHKGKLWFLFGDTLATETLPVDPLDGKSHSGPHPLVADSTAYTTDTDPTDCVSLEFLSDPDNPGFWRNPSFDQDGGAVQEEGLSVGDSMYVWFSTGRDGGTLTLARSDNDGQSFTILHDVSTDRFIGASVDVIPNLVIPGLEEVGKTDWLFVFGIGPVYRQSDLFLAAVPLAMIEDPQAMLYFAGLGENGLPRWSESEDDAQPVIDVDNPLATGDWFAGVPLKEQANAEGCIGEYSVHYSEVAETWIAMYNCDFLYIQMHTADFPWGPWSQAVTVFDPVKDGGYCGFLHLTDDFEQILDLNCDYNVTVPGRSDPGSPYGPYIMERYTTGHRNQATLYFVMSMWHPYNVLVMTTQIQRQ